MNTLVKVSIQDFFINLPQDVADVWTNDIDGVVCASSLMEYQVDVGMKKRYHKSRYGDSVLTVGFYKGENFCFEVRFDLEYITDNVEKIMFHYSQDFYNDKAIHVNARQYGLNIDFYDCIEVQSEEQMKNLFKFIRFLL